MRALSIFAGVALSFIAYGGQLSLAHGECYGDAAAAYGCGVPAKPAQNRPSRGNPSLEQFGTTDGPVLPDTGFYDQSSNSTDVITAEERYRMMRNIVLGRGGSSRSRRAQISAVESAARPLRRSGSMPARTR
jgi:hypothetical protein